MVEHWLLGVSRSTPRMFLQHAPRTAGETARRGLSSGSRGAWARTRCGRDGTPGAPCSARRPAHTGARSDRQLRARQARRQGSRGRSAHGRHVGHDVALAVALDRGRRADPVDAARARQLVDRVELVRRERELGHADGRPPLGPRRGQADRALVRDLVARGEAAARAGHVVLQREGVLLPLRGAALGRRAVVLVPEILDGAAAADQRERDHGGCPLSHAPRSSEGGFSAPIDGYTGTTPPPTSPYLAECTCTVFVALLCCTVQ